MRDPDVLVIGSGLNGLVAACRLAKRGLSVWVLEESPRRPGGSLGSETLTQPGFVHDVGTAFFPFAHTSPAFIELELERYGVTWLRAPIESAHPALDGSCASILRDREAALRSFGDERDGKRWQALADWYARAEPRLLAALLDSPGVARLLRVGLANAWHLGRLVLRRSVALSRKLFQGEAARRVLPALGLHLGVGPDDGFGAGYGALLGLATSNGGNAIPRGGARSITNALVTILEAHGGRLRLGTRVDHILTDRSGAVGVRTEHGDELRAKRAVIADTSEAAMYLRLLDERWTPRRVRRAAGSPQSWGTFKLDLAISGPVPWVADAARKSAVVYAAESVADLRAFTEQVMRGRLPERPCLFVGQQSLVDDARATRNQHTLHVSTRVPMQLELGWDSTREAFADRIVARIEALAPGFGRKIMSRSARSPADLQERNESSRSDASLRWRTRPSVGALLHSYDSRTAVSRLYLASSDAHPGVEVHGMCGYHAARACLREL